MPKSRNKRIKGWEYCIIDASSPSAIMELNELGKVGWELVSVENRVNQEQYEEVHSQTFAYLKKLLISIQKPKK